MTEPMKIAVIVVRSLMGLLLLFASVTFLLQLITPAPPVGAMKTFTDGLAASTYLMPLVKVLELVCAIAFLTGRFVPLAAVVLAPITVNIVLVHVFLDPKGLPVALFLAFANAFVAYYHRAVYRPLFNP